jgi:hypothetical protein
MMSKRAQPLRLPRRRNEHPHSSFWHGLVQKAGQEQLGCDGQKCPCSPSDPTLPATQTNPYKGTLTGAGVLEGCVRSGLPRWYEVALPGGHASQPDGPFHALLSDVRPMSTGTSHPGSSRAHPRAAQPLDGRSAAPGPAPASTGPVSSGGSNVCPNAHRTAKGPFRRLLSPE